MRTQLKYRYYALCATAAAFTWLKEGGVSFGPGTLQIRYTTLKGKPNGWQNLNTDTLFVDAETAANLELTVNSLSHTAANSLFGEPTFW